MGKSDISELYEKKDVKGLIKALDRKRNSSDMLEEYNVKQAIGALSKIGDNRAIKPLINFLQKSEKATLIKDAIVALAEFSDPQVIPILLPYLKDSDRYVRETTANCCRFLNDARVITALCEGLRDENIQVGKACLNSISLLKAFQAVPFLEKVLKEMKKEIKINPDIWKQNFIEKLQETLVSFGSSSIIEQVKQEDPSKLGDFLVKDILQITALTTEAGLKQKMLIEDLINLGQPAIKSISLAWTQIYGKLEGANWAVLNFNYTWDSLEQVIEALGRIGGSEAFSLLKEIIDLAFYDFFSKIAEMHTHIIPGAVRGLGKLGNPNAIPFLKSLKPRLPQTTSAIQESLKQLGDKGTFI